MSFDNIQLTLPEWWGCFLMAVKIAPLGHLTEGGGIIN